MSDGDARGRASRVVVIGAGPAGLAVAACLSKAGVPFDLLERRDAVGSAWRSHYKRLHLHTAKTLSSLPFVPFDADVPTFVPRQRFVEYLDGYARRFGLQPRFGVDVRRVARGPDGGFVVETAEETISARAVVFATGYNRVPERPSFEGMDRFAGEVVHSSQYADGAPFRAKRVLVVGSGNSGAEIALDLWEHGAHPRICIRGPVHVVPRDLFGLPIQHVTVGLRFLSPSWMDRLAAPLAAVAVGDLSRYGLRKPAKGAAVMVKEDGRIPLVDVGTVSLIRQGLLPVVPALARFDERGVTSVDGVHHALDAVILATGYGSGLRALLDPSLHDLLDQRQHPTVHGAEAAGGLFFLGFSNPQTGALREIALEARRIADQIAEKARA